MNVDCLWAECATTPSALLPVWATMTAKASSSVKGIAVYPPAQKVNVTTIAPAWRIRFADRTTPARN